MNTKLVESLVQVINLSWRRTIILMPKIICADANFIVRLFFDPPNATYGENGKARAIALLLLQYIATKLPMSSIA